MSLRSKLHRATQHLGASEAVNGTTLRNAIDIICTHVEASESAPTPKTDAGPAPTAPTAPEAPKTRTRKGR